MAEVTAVPLQPIRKGAVAKLWLGVVLVLLAGVALAWFTVPATVTVTTVKAGIGGSPSADDVVYVNYTGKLSDGTVFDKGKGVQFPLGEGMIAGFTQGLTQMQKGGSYTLYIPAQLGFGANPPPNSKIPPNSDLVFDIDLIDFMSRADYQRRMQIMQKLQQMQQQKNGAGAPPQ